MKSSFFIIKSLHKCIMSICIVVLFVDCKNNSMKPTEYLSGDIISATSLGLYSPNEILQIFNSSQISIPFDISYSVKALSITYQTTDAQGNNIEASGAFFIPQGIANLPLLSIQHGTETKRDLVASVSPYNSTEGITGLLTASMGYMTIIPDYPGFGVSDEVHPYFHAKSLIPCVIDFIYAGKSYCLEHQIILDGSVFLTGYSEGGYVTLATQKTIEEEFATEIHLAAVAPLGGLYDLVGTFDNIFNDDTYSTPAYVAYFFNAYNKIYNWNRLNDIFNSQYSSIIPELFDGSKSWIEVVNQLPTTFSGLMNPAFITNVVNGNEQSILETIQENTLLDWIPKAPMHFFHGDIDRIAPYINTLTTVDALTENGAANILLTVIPNGTHETAGPSAIFGAIQWFESFK